MLKIEVERTETSQRWDYVSTFKPGPELSLELGQISNIERLLPDSVEFQFIAKRFIETFSGVAS